MRQQINDQLATELLDEMFADIQEDRTGQHPSVTDLIDCLTKTFFNQFQPREFSRQTKVYFLVGLGLESSLLKARKEAPIFGETDGIYWHVDSFDDSRLIELKSTRASRKKHSEGDWPFRYMAQVKSYLKAVGELEVDLAVIYLIPGDFEVWHLSFEQSEIDDHWDWMQGRKEVWNRARETNSPPQSFKYNAEWECKDCQYKMVCDLRVQLEVN